MTQEKARVLEYPHYDRATAVRIVVETYRHRTPYTEGRPFFSAFFIQPAHIDETLFYRRRAVPDGFEEFCLANRLDLVPY